MKTHSAMQQINYLIISMTDLVQPQSSTYILDNLENILTKLENICCSKWYSTIESYAGSIKYQ